MNFTEYQWLVDPDGFSIGASDARTDLAVKS